MPFTWRCFKTSKPQQLSKRDDPQIAHSVSETMPYHAISNPSLAQERLPQDSCGWAGLHALRCVSPLIFEKKRPNEKAQTFPVGCVWGFLKMKHCRMDKQFLCVAQRDSIRLNENHAVSKYHPFLTIWYISSSYTTIPHFMGQSVSKDYNRYDIP